MLCLIPFPPVEQRNRLRGEVFALFVLRAATFPRFLAHIQQMSGGDEHKQEAGKISRDVTSALLVSPPQREPCGSAMTGSRGYFLPKRTSR